ncbi:addiction module component CHP02574 family protein [Agrobacterium tumefaciens]|uniref:Addiction module component n=1 Tax=Pedobacter psychrotolerans TaxID=1843235 RepID=A0A4R2HKY4_9SPHI|nr:addiction module component CHP02574 family protein [Pedobacter psychrotolerans]NTE00785.1 addiction module component CHP02574 family protein [Agrobacterium tumefaciens]NTE23760.1 addiction module component CHP02574 family protein [Agrobacterium tumefaciens]TCO30700.1 hypothetical protein EV200_101135 [Pedobacter psychrotolerans]GGE68181.1 hypothetical protein GCM10011413_38550 [Pedobacter psychrotolerans]
MSIQYLSNEQGQITAVQLPIEDWEKIKNLYPNVESIDFSLPEWHKEILDARLQAIVKDSSRIAPISELLNELDK